MKNLTAHFTSEQLEQMSKQRIPRHIAFIPDGNRRWAKKQHKSTLEGHQAGADNIMDIIEASKEIGVKVVTIWIFSTENWTRDLVERQGFFWLLESYLNEQRQTMIDNGIRFCTIGDLSRMPLGVRQAVQATKEATANCNELDMVFAINYGARDELRRAVLAMMDDFEQNKLKREEMTETLIASYLDTVRWPDPDLVIRTSGEYRLSNFMLLQSSYAEFHFTDVLWPDFSPQRLFEAVISYQARERRWGK